jgi:hypothetical protein
MNTTTGINIPYLNGLDDLRSVDGGITNFGWS